MTKRVPAEPASAPNAVHAGVSVPHRKPLAVAPKPDAGGTPAARTPPAEAVAAPRQLPELDAGQSEALSHGRLSDPFAMLGPHPDPLSVAGITHDSFAHIVRVYVPGAQAVELLIDGHASMPLQHSSPAGCFVGRAELPHDVPLARSYRLGIVWEQSDGEPIRQETADPYAFGILISDFDLHLIAEGRHRELARCLGAQVMSIDQIPGVRFAVWAPNALRVSVVGDFNGWDGRRHIMRLRHHAGIWELFIPQQMGAQIGQRYKYEIVDQRGNVLPLKADPVALQAEAPPATASVISDPAAFVWNDAAWLAQREATSHVPGCAAKPLSIYEVHVGSWRRAVNQPDQGWNFLGDTLIPYVCELGFTHIELLPVMEYPFGGSWGYQPLSQFAPTARFGSPRDFARFVDRCHSAGIGVILDWVPAHFPTDTHGLAQFDGTALYEYADPREGFHHDWNTLIYNLGRHEVRGFMIASALEWLERFHIDGLRVDAVASMLYRDYSRKSGEWLPNQYGGRENLESVAFLRELNQIVAERVPGAITLAEESTSWPGVTAPVAEQGLGFSFKWNMGWMHDTLQYLEHDPIHRAWHYHDMTFGLVYAWSERFVLPLSHDEVVHGKKSLLEKMPGDRWQQFANLRAYLGFMWAHPGKKLLFMGCEIAQIHEWDHDSEIAWWLLDQAPHRGMQRLVTDLNHLLTHTPALYSQDASPDGFAWAMDGDPTNSVYAFVRYAGGPGFGNEMLLCVSNMTPVPHLSYRIGVPAAGHWRECLNTDAEIYGGSNLGNGGSVLTEEISAHGQPASLVLTLPPLATIMLRFMAN